jgi:hypothetical protein
MSEKKKCCPICKSSSNLGTNPDTENLSLNDEQLEAADPYMCYSCCSTFSEYDYK